MFSSLLNLTTSEAFTDYSDTVKSATPAWRPGPRQTPAWPHVALTKFVPPSLEHDAPTSLGSAVQQQRTPGPRTGGHLNVKMGFGKCGNTLDIGKAIFFPFLSNHRPSQCHDHLKNMTSGCPSLPSSLTVHSSHKSQSSVSILFSTREMRRGKTLSLLYLKNSEAGGISLRGGGPLGTQIVIIHLLESMLIFLVHHSLLRPSQQSRCLLPVCMCASVHVN